MAVLERIVEIFGGTMPEVSWAGLATTVIALAAALVMCFLGYRLLKVFVALNGLGVGAVIGILIGGRISESAVVTLILVIVFAVGFFLISFLIYKAGIFILTGFTVFTLLMTLLPRFKLPLDPRLIALIAAVVIGIISVIAVRPLTILVTAFAGGFMAAAEALELLEATVALPAFVGIIGGVVLMIIGAVVQFKTTKDKKQKKKRK